MKIRVQGVDMTVDVDDQGIFITYMDSGNTRVEAETLKELEKEVTRRARAAKVEVAIPFSMWRDDHIQHGTAHGLHQRSRNILVRWEDGTAEQLPHWTGIECFSRLSAEEAREYEEITRKKNELGAWLFAFHKAHKIELRGEVSSAVRAVVVGKEDEGVDPQTTGV